MKRSSKVLLGIVGVVLLFFVLQIIFVRGAASFSEPKRMLHPHDNTKNYALTFVLEKDDILYYTTDKALNLSDLTQIKFDSASIKTVIDSIKPTLKSERDLTIKIIPAKGSTYKNIVDLLDIMAVLKIKNYTLEEAVTPD